MTGEDDKFPELEESNDIEEFEMEEEIIEEPAEAIFEHGKGYVSSEDADIISKNVLFGNRFFVNIL